MKISITSKLASPAKVDGSDYPSLTPIKTVYVADRTRGGVEQIIEVNENHLVELVYDDGTRWLCSPTTLDEFYPNGNQINRDGEEIFRIDSELAQVETSRGLLKDLVLKIFNVFTKGTVKKSIKQLAENLQDRQLAGFSGLVRIDKDFQLSNTGTIAVNKPCLIFIHGTNSSTTGSFEDVRGTKLWHYILKTYGDNVFGFQHETLTKGPLQNTLELVKQLPPNAIIDIITYSRGGLIGDIISRFNNSEGSNAGFNSMEISFLEKEGRDDDIVKIKAIQDALKNKKIFINKFIRIASPSAGTTILSKRIDYFFNISLNLLGTVPFLSNPVYHAMKELLVEAIDQKNDIKILPGLEAMNPDSPIITLLNNLQSSQDLSVSIYAISGSCKVNLSLKALLVLVSKLFYWEDNDLVVNTKSMYAGAARKEKLQYLFDEATDVDHFHYFSNERTNDGILAALAFSGKGIVDNFTQFERGLDAGYRNVLLNLEGGEYSTGDPSGERPIVLLLPGIMGSCLKTNGKLTWIQYLSFFTGGLKNIAIETPDVISSGMVKTSYKELGDALGDEYDLVTFHFDWRIALRETAKQLATCVEKLMVFNQPIKVIGHSMGGVLVRDFMVYHTELWKKLNNSKDFKLLFLGAPLGGSFRIINVLFGEDDLIKKLSKIDLFHSKKELLGIFSKFPGIISLLPLNLDAKNDFGNLDIWKEIRNAFGVQDWPLPEADLPDFIEHRTMVSTSTSIDYSNAIYIAGKDSHTPCGYRIDTTSAGKDLVLLSTGEGDQSVTWESGIPKQIIANDNVYYCSYSHGALSCTPALFGAIREIIKTGRTRLITKKRPQVRSSEKVFRRPERSDLDLSPKGIEDTILGITEKQDLSDPKQPLRVRVVHADLRYAKYPVLAGHFKNDGILYGEATIDLLLNRKLSEQLNLGIYPTDIGTHELKLRKGNFKGAIIVGLGEPGKLTSFELTRTVEQAAVKYLLEVNDSTNTFYTGSEVGISSLIIGCGYGGLSVESSIQAILSGVINANRKVKVLFSENAMLIADIEFIERYEDNALSGLYAAKRLMKNMLPSFNIQAEQITLIKKAGSRRRLNTDQVAEWWIRITITSIDAQVDSPSGLRFAISTGAAREDVRINFVDLKSLDSLISHSSQNSKWDREAAKAIFELLIPIDFKGRLKRHGNIIWVLDKNTSGFPWEMLLDNSKDARPLSINSGMIRQLATGDTRINIEPVAHNTALVVGEPDLLGFLPALPGAAEEAKAIAKLLNENGYVAKELVHAFAADIIPALICPSYKIMHLAGHGIFGNGSNQMSGMVLGPDSYLTTAHIKQMSTTPELVFINCCYLGKIDVAREEFYQSRYKLAANLGTQMIEIGVKAVVVAGWAVNDSAALVFSKTFYQNMFDGKPFGEAVRDAREYIYNNFTDDNTWAAYQCYGDPYYKLVETAYVQKGKTYLISEQADIDLQNLISNVEMGDFTDEDVLNELNAISAEVDLKGLRNPQITEQEATVYIALNQFDTAIEKFQNLIASEDSSYSLKSLEQYLNIRAKALFKKVEQDNILETDLLADFDRLSVDLKSIISIAPSAERYNLLGSLFKRQATVATRKNQIKKGITNAMQNYEFAYTRTSSIYSFTNFLILKFLLQMDADPKPEITEEQEVDRLLKVFHDNVSEAAKPWDEIHTAKDDYWARIEYANLLFCKWLLNADRPEFKRAAELTKVIEVYKNIWNMIGNKNQKKTEIDHISILVKLITKINPNHDVINSLTQFKSELLLMI